MPYLVAQGADPGDQWRRQLPPDVTVTLGRSVGWPVPWDPALSREHVKLTLRAGQLHVERLPQAVNPVFVRGRTVDSCQLNSGEFFVIGATRFLWFEDSIEWDESDSMAAELGFNAESIRGIPFTDPQRRLTVLSDLPAVLEQIPRRSELLRRLCNVLLAGVGVADEVAILRASRVPSAHGVPQVLHWDRRVYSDRPFRPSRRLIEQVSRSRESVLHVWSANHPESEPSYTLQPHGSWALASPVEGDAEGMWVLYVCGERLPTDVAEAESPVAGLKGPASRGENSESQRRLRGELRFVDLVAAIVGRSLRIQQLERAQVALRPFFPASVREILEREDPAQALAPRLLDAAVLFCDLRGFSRRSEQEAGDLLGLLARVSQVLGVTSRQILATDGVIGDFHGDATMGFWGWPLEDPRRIESACRTALAIQQELTERAASSADPLAGFELGIGIAAGQVVAGQIGTAEQVKVTAFGPVVNLAARLETMTRVLRGSILIDDATALVARERLSDEARVRKIAVVKPPGLDSPVAVHQLLPITGHRGGLPDSAIEAYEQAWELVAEGDWETAFSVLHRVPSEDRVKDFLTVLIARHDRRAPDSWPGYVTLDSK